MNNEMVKEVEELEVIAEETMDFDDLLFGRCPASSRCCK
jgi:hypothetical protein